MKTLQELVEELATSEKAVESAQQELKNALEAEKQAKENLCAFGIIGCMARPKNRTMAIEGDTIVITITITKTSGCECHWTDKSIVGGALEYDNGRGWSLAPTFLKRFKSCLDLHGMRRVLFRAPKVEGKIVMDMTKWQETPDLSQCDIRPCIPGLIDWEITN